MASLRNGLRVPPGHRPVLEALAALDDRLAEQIFGELESLPDFLTPAALEAGVNLASEHFEPADLVQVGLAMATQTKFHGWTSAELAKGVAVSTDLELDGDVRDVLRPRIERLLDVPAIRSTARAADLQAEHQRQFHDARVLTDLRPVFGPDAAQAPGGAVINEVLKVEYFEGQETKALFVALDRSDLERLKQVIDRALTKTETLRAFLESAGLSYFEVEAEEDK